MPLITKHQISQLFEKYHQIEVTFNQRVIDFTRFIPSDIHLKLGTDKYSCILNSSSMDGAHIILRANKTFFEKVNKYNKWVSLRLAFKWDNPSNPLTFFIKSKVKSISPLKGAKSDLYIMDIEYYQQPPDDFIEILGKLIDAGAHLNNRSHKRISLNEEALNVINLESSSGILNVNGHNIPCILRDISLAGCKIIAKGAAAGFQNQKIVVMLRFRGETSFTKIPGNVVRIDEIENNQSLTSMGIEFFREKIPATYLKAIRDYMEKETEA